MAKYPEVQRKAQEEIDRVIGSERLPNLDDRDKLPFIEAIVLEILRWHPIGPMGLPHSCDQDVVFGNYLIPKDSYLMPNVWYMLCPLSTYTLSLFPKLGEARRTLLHHLLTLKGGLPMAPMSTKTPWSFDQNDFKARSQRKIRARLFSAMAVAYALDRFLLRTRCSSTLHSRLPCLISKALLLTVK